MNRLTKATASAMLLLMSATPAWAMATEGSVSSPADPTAIRTLVAPADLEIIHSHAPADKPVLILLENKAITFDQKQLVVDGTLMVPLRAIVESAGGEVSWDGEIRRVTVRLGDRKAMFVIGADQAEMNQDGVNYLQRNMIRMAKSPILAGGRTLVAADALSSVLGLLEQSSAAGTMNLVRAPKPQLPASPAEEEQWVIKGTVKESRPNEDGLSILVEGPLMSNGEGSLTWFAVTAGTQISVMENGVQREGSMADLAVAQQVVVRPVGPLLMSFPARGGAASIVVYK